MSEREAWVPRRVAVVGAGTMGHGIAQVSAMAGAETVLTDVSEEALASALERVRANLEKGVSLGKVESAARDRALALLGSTAELPSAVEGADLVVEAVPEDRGLKDRVLAQMEEAAAEDVLLATNTSSFSIDELAGALRRPERFLGLHFFNPVHIMGLVEVVHGERTAPEALDRGVGFVAALGKEPVVVKDSPGFASSRLGVALGLEAMRMLEEGVARPRDIDRAMELGYRHPMGPLRLSDLIGLDTRLGIAEYLHETLGGERFRPPGILRRMVEEGKLGRKTGRGFYEWDADGNPRSV